LYKSQLFTALSAMISFVIFRTTWG